MTERLLRFFTIFATLLVFALLLAPIVGLISGASAVALYSRDLSAVQSAFALSGVVVCVALLISLGPGSIVAWQLSRASPRQFGVSRWLLALPMALPPSVLGLGLLLTFGREGWLTQLVGAERGIALTVSAAYLAAIVTSLPYFVVMVSSAMRRVSPDALLAARSLGANDSQLLKYVVFPSIAPTVGSAAGVVVARASGEFGATMIFAGSVVGHTRTASVAIYEVLYESAPAAAALALVLLAFVFGVQLTVGRVSESNGND